jgi:uncharacterized membrane protein HdeD (DUF308 family)
MTSQNIAGIQDRIRAAIQTHWKAVLIEGILFVILGLAAIIVPAVASLAITIFLAWLFLVSGAFGLAMTIWERHMPGFWWSLLSALLALGAGIALLVRPVQGTLTLTIIVGAYFLAEGVFTIMYALAHRRDLSERWGWLLASGVVDLILAGLIIAGLPGSAVWAIGLLVGIDMLFGGASLISMALAARDADRLRTHCGWGQTPGAT